MRMRLLYLIRNKTSVPRTLLRNGKRSKDELCISQARHQAVVDTSVGTHPLSHSPLVNRTSQPRADTSVGTRPLLHSPLVNRTSQSQADTSVGTHPLLHSPLVNRTSQSQADSSAGTLTQSHSPVVNSTRHHDYQDSNIAHESAF